MSLGLATEATVGRQRSAVMFLHVERRIF